MNSLNFNEPPTCLEIELSNAIRDELGGVSQFGGVYLPLRSRAAGLDTKTDAGGGYTRATTVPDPIDALIGQSKVLSLGAELISNLRGNVAFPAEDNVLAAQFQAENPGSDASDSDPSLQQVNLSAKMLIGATSFTRKLLEQSSAQIDRWVTSRLMRAHSLAVDIAAINGCGNSNEPPGLLQQEINIVSGGADGAVPTSAKIHEQVRVVGDSNADSPNCGFLTSPKMREVLSQTARFTGAATALWNDDRMVGYRAEVSSNVPQTLVKGSSGAVCHAILFGYWPSLMVGEWGVLEIVPDIFAQKKRGLVQVSSYQMVDIAVRSPKAFSAIVDAKVS